MTPPARRLPSIPGYSLPAPSEIPSSRPDWRLVPDRAALLIHDMQTYFVDAFTPGVEPITTMTANIAKLAAAARKRGIPVFYTAQNGDQDRRDRGLQADLWGPGMRHIPEHQPIVQELTPEEGDIVLVKHRYSAFQRSNLETLMRVRGRDQIVVCGVYAHIGCMLTVGEAFQRDIEPFFVADALGDFSREWHDTALAQVADCMGVVLTTNQIVEELS